jgi:hypothetical protein
MRSCMDCCGVILDRSVLGIVKDILGQSKSQVQVHLMIISEGATNTMIIALWWLSDMRLCLPRWMITRHLMRRIIPHRMNITGPVAFFVTCPLIIRIVHQNSDRESITQKPWRRDTSAHAATKRLALRASLNTTTGILRRISTARKALRLNSPSDRLQCPTGNTAVHRHQNQSHHGCSQLIVTTIPPRHLRMRPRNIIMSLMSMRLTKRPPYAPRVRYVQFLDI